MRTFGKRFATLGLVIVIAGAGAAVGPILARKLTGQTAVTARQALNLALPVVDMAYTPVPTIIGGATAPPGYVTAAQLPLGARLYESLDDGSMQFTVAVDLVATSSKFDVVVPIGNLSNNQVVALVQLDIPDGLDVDVQRSGPIAVDTGVPPIVSVGGRANFTRLNPNTWEGMWPAFTPPSDPPTADLFLTNIVGYNGFVMHIALHNGTPPGFYTIQGKVVPRNV